MIDNPPNSPFIRLAAGQNLKGMTNAAYEAPSRYAEPPRFAKRLRLAVEIAGGLLPPNAEPPAVPDPAECQLSATDRAMLAAVNAARASSRSCGKRFYEATSPLRWNCTLAAVADAHSKDMASHNFLDHTGPDGLGFADRIHAAGYVSSALGENVAAGYPTVDAVLQSWLESPGHCSNIMNPRFHELGAAFAESAVSTYKIYWTQVFGAGQ